MIEKSKLKNKSIEDICKEAEIEVDKSIKNFFINFKINHIN